MSSKIAVVVVYGVACTFIRLFHMLVVVYAANLLELIAPCFPAGLLQLLKLAVYDAAQFQPIVVFLL